MTNPRPDWLGSRTVPTDGNGNGLVIETPPELHQRRFATVDILPPPSSEQFEITKQPLLAVPEVLARSTWNQGCPVEPTDLTYLTVSFWGFDEQPHTGEMIVHSSVADDIGTVFETLHQARYPIEEMRVVAPAELDALPTGDGNNTTAFVCRSVVGGSTFSQHAYGLAADVNPFLNPYVRGERVLPEQASVYTDRSLGEPAIITEGDVVHEAFIAIGWQWGGEWQSLKDYQHFSANGQ